MKGYACGKCGSDRVQLAMWVRPNTGEVVEPLFDHAVPGVTSRWCEVCEGEVELVRTDAEAPAPRALTLDDVEVTLAAEPEDEAVRGHFASDDPAEDAEMEGMILRRLLDGDPWAWFLARVTVTWRGLSASDTLGCCSYDSEEEFRKGGYYDDMVSEALGELNRKVAAVYADIRALTEGE